MHTVRKLVGLVVLGLLAAVVYACAGSPTVEGRPVIVTRVPAGHAVAGPDPAARYPDGSRLVRIDLDHPEIAPRWITEGMTAAGGASVSIDGAQIVFVGKESPDEAFAVWLSAVDGSGRRRVAAPGADCGGAAFLPDGRIVFSSRLPAEEDTTGSGEPWALFVVDLEAGEPMRITFGGSELDPAVLADGRIVHAHWQPGGDGRPDSGSYSLFTVHPDGAGDAPLHGQHGGPRFKLLPRQLGGEDVFFLAGEEGGGPATLAAADWRSPARDGYTVPLPGASPLAVEPTASGTLLVAAGKAGLLEVDTEGAVLRTVPAGDAAWEVVHGVEALPRPRPQGQLSLIDPAGRDGKILCLDARSPGHPEAARVRLRTAAADGAEGTVLGEVPLAEDGSFFVTVPANRPLLLELLDRHGKSVGATRTPIWVRPREVRGCIGCHEDPETAPPNVRPAAVRAEPVDLTGEPAPEVAG